LDLASDPDPALFVSGFQDFNKKVNIFFLITLCRYIYFSLQKYRNK
jgi:hypothetical protein